MKNFVSRFKAFILALALPFALIQTAKAQPFCNVNIEYQTNPVNNQISFVAQTSGDSACFSSASVFTWSFGDGTSGTGRFPSHIYSQPGLYVVCVTATTSSAQTVVDCDTVEITNPISNCQGVLNFVFTTSSGTIGTNYQFDNTSLFSISACISGNTQFTWTFGDGTSASTFGNNSVIHSFTSAGTYIVCLKAVTLQGSPIEVCKSVEVINTNVGLGGLVQADGICLQSPVRVELIGLSNNAYQVQTLTGTADSCFYNFNIQSAPGAPTGSYIIRATPLTNNDYLSTYFGDAIFWSDATVLQPTQSQYNLTINLVPAAALAPGLGLVTGTINGNGTTVNTTFNGNPITTTFNVTASRVIILNSLSQPVGFAFANANGTFSFPDLPVGEYQLRVDNPKVPSQTVPFSITANATSVNINMNTTGSGITTVTSNSKKIQSANLVAYPNPASEEISMEGVSGSVEIMDAKGQIVLKTSEVKNIRISNLASGLYMIKAFNNKMEPVSTRFVKK